MFDLLPTGQQCWPSGYYQGRVLGIMATSGPDFGVDRRRPVPAAIALVVRGEEILLIRRARPPDAGRWAFPGGKIDFGESLLAAAERELLEETNVEADALRVITALDAFDGMPTALHQHFILVGVLCRWRSGEPRAADDATHAAWHTMEAMSKKVAMLSRDVLSVGALAFSEMARGESRPAFRAPRVG